MSYSLSRLEHDLLYKTDHDPAGYFIDKIFDYTLQKLGEEDEEGNYENDEKIYIEMDEGEIRKILKEGALKEGGLLLEEFGIEHYKNHKEDIERAYACRKNDGSINASLPISNDYKVKIHYVILQELIELGHLEA